jgi:S-adenosylmethionine-dependent methyltransferase
MNRDLQDYLNNLDTPWGMMFYKMVWKQIGDISIMSKAVFENQIDEAIDLLDGAEVQAKNFGKVRYYDIEQLVQRTDDLRIIKTLGIRTFWGLQQNNEAKCEDNWSDQMLQIEMKVSEMNEFISIAFFHHEILGTKFA